MSRHTDWCIGGDKGPCNCGTVDEPANENLDTFARFVTDIQMAHAEKRMAEINRSEPNQKFTMREIIKFAMEVDPLRLENLLKKT